MSGKKNGHVSPSNPVLWKEPPLGRVSAMAMKTLCRLGDDASGQRVLEELSAARGKWMDPTAVYGPIRQALSRAVDPYLERAGERRSTIGGPPLMVYKVTDAGERALRETIAYHRAMAAFLEAGLPKEKSGEQEPEKMSGRKGTRKDRRDVDP